METLSDELLGAIALYLPSIQDLQSLALTSHHFCKWTNHSGSADKVYRSLYYKTHFPKADQCIDPRVTGRQLWKSNFHLKQSIVLARRRRPVDRRRRRTSREHDDDDDEEEIISTLVIEQRLNTVLILPREEEKEAIYYDNDVEPPGERCIGYFGLQPLFPSLSNNKDNDKSLTPVAIWGDYPGLRVAPCWDALLNANSPYRDQLQSIHDPPKSQVMDLQMHPRPDCLDGYSSPFFLGFASGIVMAVAYKNNQLTVLSTSKPHTSEVTCLTILPHNNQNSVGYLLSVCVTGQVYLYPHSLTNMDLSSRYYCLNPIHTPPFQVFSMSATNGGVLCLGGQGLKVSLWQLAPTENDTTTENQRIQVVTVRQFEYQPHVAFDVDDEEEPNPVVEHNITKLSFVGGLSNNNNKNDLLVMGTSLGHIVTWDLEGPTSTLKLHTSRERAHSGSVESVERVGNILLTAGGKDGMLKAMNLDSGLPIANIRFHPGPRYQCAVVQSCVSLERESIIGFCRDGHISEWSFRPKQDGSSYYGGQAVTITATVSCKRKRPKTSKGRKASKR